MKASGIWVLGSILVLAFNFSCSESYAESSWQSYARPDDAVVEKSLSDLQFDVIRRSGTEPPFRNEFWDNHEAGLYVDRLSGEPLFSSKDKFDSGTGWPSFTKALRPVQEKTDSTLGFKRTEIRSKNSDSHLGHLFDDGPQPTGRRYCINSASLRFVPASQLKAQGYAEYLNQFESANK